MNKIEMMPVGMNLREVWDTLREVGGQQTVDHSLRVGKLMYDFAETIGEDKYTWRDCGFLHDIGKIGVPADIIASKTSLTRVQFSKIKHHVVAGAGYLWNLKMWKTNSANAKAHQALAIACSDFHHAWVDGTHDSDDHKGGYYRGMKDREEYSFKGEAIPFIARCCALCDVFEAITANRSYDPARTPQEALHIMARGFGRQFDKNLFFVFFVSVLKKEGCNFTKEEVAEAIKASL